MSTEERLRAALRAGASTVVEHEPPPLAPRRPAPRRTLSLVAAVAAVAVLAVALTLVVDHTHRRTLHPVASPSIPRVTSIPVRRSCAVALPASWRTALRAHRATLSTVYDAVQAVSDAGAALVVSTTNGHAPQLIAIRPDGSRRVAWSSGVAGGMSDVSTSGRWATFLQNGDAGSDEIDAVDLASGLHIVVRRPSMRDSGAVTRPVVSDGVVYWRERGTIYAYDLYSRTRRTLASGATAGPDVVGTTVFWRSGSRTTSYRGSGILPAGYRIGGDAPAVTSASTVAWVADEHGTAVVRSEPIDSARPVDVYRTGHPAARIAAAGPYLAIVTDGRSFVLDTRTGARTEVGGPALPTEYPIAGGGGTLALRGPVAGVELSVVPVSSLPELTC